MPAPLNDNQMLIQPQPFWNQINHQMSHPMIYSSNNSPNMQNMQNFQNYQNIIYYLICIIIRPPDNYLLKNLSNQHIKYSL